MRASISIKRGKNIKTYEVECSGEDSLAAILERINETEQDPVEWECSCRQNTCGACAMLINGRPALACATFIKDTGLKVSLAPLRKFPLIRDLKVDRSIIRGILSEMQTWLSEGSAADSEEAARQYLAASCMMCGCCMEVCPNFSGRGSFGSALAANTMYKTISQEPDGKRRRKLAALYRKKQFSKCTNSLACSEVCPLELPMASTLSRLNGKMFRK